MLDDMFDYIEHVRERPVWQPIPQAARDQFHAELPRKPTEIGEAYDQFSRFVAPYTSGNIHPGSWVGFMAAARRSVCWPKCWRRD